MNLKKERLKIYYIKGLPDAMHIKDIGSPSLCGPTMPVSSRALLSNIVGWCGGTEI